MDKYDKRFSHTELLVMPIFAQLIDTIRHPQLMHCKQGVYITGIVVICSRRLQNWSLEVNYDAVVRYTKSNDTTVEEKQIVESSHA